MEYYIQHGVCFSTAVGTDERPEVTRWTSWGHGDLQQSYLLHTAEGTLVVDPVLPKSSDGLRALKRRAGKVTAIISGKKLDVRYEDGEELPGGVQAISSGDENGEMWVYWTTPGDRHVLINADTIYGQNRLGGLGGRRASYWMQVGGIRLRATGKMERGELRNRYRRIDPLDIDLVLNGHNPLPLDDDPKAAVVSVLSEGTYEIHPSGTCTFMYMDFGR